MTPSNVVKLIPSERGLSLFNYSVLPNMQFKKPTLEAVLIKNWLLILSPAHVQVL